MTKIQVCQPFQAFATTVGGRVGTGNIAGTATAIFMGGPGALFWMWITAILRSIHRYCRMYSWSGL